MTKVSTRPHAGATQAPPAGDASPTTADAQDCVAWEQIALAGIAPLLSGLENARDIEANSINGSGLPYRLLRDAYQKLSSISMQGAIEKNDVANDLFDVEACLRGALGICLQLQDANDMTAEGRALVVDAIDQVDKLTDFLCGGIDGDSDVESDATRRPSADDSSVYTPQQLENVLETVAGQADTLRRLLMQSQTADAYEASVSLDAAVIIACGIGAMADGAVGSSIIGDYHHWTYGPLFDSAGKAVQS